MKNIARVIVTYECFRSCTYCRNKCIFKVRQVRFEDLLRYDELIISGGEPMLIGEMVVEMMHRLRVFYGYKGKMWIDTSSLNVNRWADKAVIRNIDGIKYTFNYGYTQNDLRLLKKLSNYLDQVDRSVMYNRLNIDNKLKKDINWDDIRLGNWDCVQWIDHTSEVNKDTDVVFYDLEKE